MWYNEIWKGSAYSNGVQLRKLSVVKQFNAKIKIHQAIHSERGLEATRQRVGPKELINYKQLTVRYQWEHWTGQGSDEEATDGGAVMSCRWSQATDQKQDAAGTGVGRDARG